MSSVAPRRAARAIFWAGFAAGVLDLLFAWIAFGKPLPALLKVIAGGWYGRAAGQGGAEVAVVGFLSHFLISLGAAAVYYAASRALPWLNRHPVIAGLTYGLLVYLVLPLSAYHTPVRFPSLLKPDVLSHLLLVGLPIAWIVRRVGPPARTPAVPV